MPMRLVVATYNVRSFRRGLQPAVSALGDRPDILLVQECGPRRATIAFARALRMEFVSSHRPLKRVRNAVLFRAPWRLVGAETRDFTPRGRTLPRGFVAARLRREALEMTAVAVHLGLAPREREAHARELTDALLAAGGPVVVGADLNEGPEEAAARWIAGRLYDSFARSGAGTGATFPSSAPTSRIDYIYAGEGLRALLCRVGGGQGEAASDHLPVIAEFELDEAP